MMQLASASRERLMCAPSSRRARSPARSEPARSMRNSRPRCTPFDTDLLTDTLYTKVTGQFNMLTSACVMTKPTLPQQRMSPRRLEIGVRGLRGARAVASREQLGHVRGVIGAHLIKTVHNLLQIQIAKIFLCFSCMCYCVHLVCVLLLSVPQTKGWMSS